MYTTYTEEQLAVFVFESATGKYISIDEISTQYLGYVPNPSFSPINTTTIHDDVDKMFEDMGINLNEI